MTAIWLHGLRVAAAVEELPVELLEGVLGRFPTRDASEPPELTIQLAPRRAPADAHGFRPAFFHGRVRGLERAGAFLLLDGSSYVHIDAGGRRIEAAVAPDADHIFVHTTLFIALVIALRGHGLFHLHAGAVERRDGRRVLILGASGAGKSTVTLALLEPGCRYLGDDALFVGARDGQPRLFGFARPFHLGPATAAAFPGLTAGPPDAAGKRAVELSRLPGEPVDRLDAPQLVLFPEIATAAETTFVPLSQADAFGRALSSSALVAVDGMSQPARQLELLGSLLRNARAYQLLVGADWLAKPAAAGARLPNLS